MRAALKNNCGQKDRERCKNAAVTGTTVEASFLGGESLPLRPSRPETGLLLWSIKQSNTRLWRGGALLSPAWVPHSGNSAQNPFGLALMVKPVHFPRVLVPGTGGRLPLAWASGVFGAPSIATAKRRLEKLWQATHRPGLAPPGSFL